MLITVCPYSITSVDALPTAPKGAHSRATCWRRLDLVRGPFLQRVREADRLLSNRAVVRDSDRAAGKPTSGTGTGKRQLPLLFSHCWWFAALAVPRSPHESPHVAFGSVNLRLYSVAGRQHAFQTRPPLFGVALPNLPALRKRLRARPSWRTARFSRTRAAAAPSPLRSG